MAFNWDIFTGRNNANGSENNSGNARRRMQVQRNYYEGRENGSESETIVEPAPVREVLTEDAVRNIIHNEIDNANIRGQVLQYFKQLEETNAANRKLLESIQENVQYAGDDIKHSFEKAIRKENLTVYKSMKVDMEKSNRKLTALTAVSFVMSILSFLGIAAIIVFLYLKMGAF